MPQNAIPYKISTLIYFRNEKNEILLMQRNKSPNKGLWSPIGGKLEMSLGESPFESARRETEEEIGLKINDEDLHLFSIIAEKNYEDRVHWLMFLFDSKIALEKTPDDIPEGNFAFFPESEIPSLGIPESDRKIIWPTYFKHRKNFVSIRIDCHSSKEMNAVTEEVLISKNNDLL